MRPDPDTIVQCVAFALVDNPIGLSRLTDRTRRTSAWFFCATVFTAEIAVHTRYACADGRDFRAAFANL